MIGILLTKKSFIRPPGDIGHPETLPFPVSIETAERPEDFLPLARSLKSKGAKAIITEHDTDLERFHELSVPIYTSPLTLLPMLKNGPGTIAILTDREATITQLLQSFQISPTDPIIISAMDDMPAFTEAYVTGTRPLDTGAVAFEMKFVAQRIMKTTPGLSGLILASPYMSAYRVAVRQVTDLPVLDIVSLATFVQLSYS